MGRENTRRLNLRDAVAGVLADTSTAGADVSGRALAESVLGQLSSTDAEILRLTAWEGLTPAEIAVVLELSDSATRTRLKRARRRAQRLLDETEPAPRLAVVRPHFQGELP